MAKYKNRKHMGRPNHDTCRAGLHDWTRENWHIRADGSPTCLLCKRETSRKSERRRYKHRRAKVGPYGFNVGREKVELVLRITLSELRPIKHAAKEAGVGYTTAKAIYWAERDRRRMLA